MRIAVMNFRLHALWVHSLKEKRMIVKSILWCYLVACTSPEYCS